jgi:T5orf172 domain
MRVQEVRSSVVESGSERQASQAVLSVQESMLAAGGWKNHPVETRPNFARPGYIYVIGTSANGQQLDIAKIGKATDPFKRIAQIEQEYRREPKMPFRVATMVLMMECWLDHMNQIETYLHRRFAKQRLEGEWFRLEAPRDWNAIRDEPTPWPLIISQCHCHLCAYDTADFLLREYPPNPS